MRMEWYKIPAAEVVEQLRTDPNTGLPDKEAEIRLDKFGPNELVEKGGRTAGIILLDQLKETMVIILIIAGLISIFLGEYIDGAAIFVIVLLNTLLGFRQEYKAEEAMSALKKMSVPTVRVRRGSHVKEISARILVPGDIVHLEAGNLVPADCRLIESVNLRVQEASLSGESEPVNKDSSFTFEDDLLLADRKNMVFMGTVVTYGRGKGIVVATGMATELGEIAELMQISESEPTPLQKRLAQLGRGLALAAIALVAIVFVLGWFQGEDLEVLFLTGISIAVAAVPEGLPAVVTIALALGARRMLKREALIRKLPAVEGLGSVTIICSDKTGTLTENRMTVTILDVANNRIELTENELTVPFRNVRRSCYDAEPDPEQAKILGANPALTLLLAGGALCNDAWLECPDDVPDGFQIVGDPTEGALLLAAARMNLLKEKLETIFPRVAEVPFDSDRKRMTTVHKMPDSLSDVPDVYRSVWDWEGWSEGIDYIEFTKGAIDSLLPLTNRVWVNKQIEPMTEEWIERINEANHSLAQSGMRVLGVACRSLEDIPKGNEDLDIEQDMIFVGLAGMIDPARPEVKDAVQTCKDAGIRTMMITGDHPLTARYIAEELGIYIKPALGDGVLTGKELNDISKRELDGMVETTSVFARVSPEQKLRIVEALQERGEIAAMTGDGVNDAPALKKADIGVAMGITGTDVSKEASDMILLDDNFATIVSAIEEGRVIYDNIRKFVQYTLSSNTGEIWVMLIAPLLGMPLPLLPLQILWINLVTDGLPGLALSVEEGEPDTMKRSPYPPNENIFSRGLGINILWVGFLMAFFSLSVGFYYWLAGDPVWQTMVFTTLTLSEMGYVMAIRSSKESVFKIGLFTNRALVGAVLLTTLLQLAVVYIPLLQELFKTVPLSPIQLLICFILSLVMFFAVEIQKLIIRLRKRG